MTYIDEEEDATDDQPTPLPQVASSSVQSTPLAGLNRNGMLNDGQNMTLKEQEKVWPAFVLHCLYSEKDEMC